MKARSAIKKIELRRFFYCLILLLILPSLTWAWQGKVVGISDGDTIKIMRNDKVEKIRLYGIDCPEKKQAFGKKAKQFTAKMVFKQTVDVNPATIDRYGWTIAWVYVGSKCLNKELLKAGLAWHYKRYSQDEELAALETVAKQGWTLE